MAISDVRVTVNGIKHEVAVEHRMLATDFLRVELALTGTHVGCEHGVCGACTIIVGGAAVRACLMLAVQLDGCEVATVEGLGTGAELHPVQSAFRDAHGLQCGFCTPGFLMSAVALLSESPRRSAEELREALSGNLCRCTGYESIIAAVTAAAAELDCEEGL